MRTALRISALALLCLISATLTAQVDDREETLAMGDFHIREGRTDEALKAYRLVLGPADSLTALAHHKMGVALYLDYRSEEAVSAYREAFKIRDNLPNSALDAARSRRNTAAALIDLEEWDQAADLLREAVATYSSTTDTDTLNWLLSLGNLMDVATAQGDYQLAMSSGRTTETLLANFTGIEPEVRQALTYNLANTYRQFEHPNRALPHARAALGLANELGYPPTHELNLLSILHSRVGNYQSQLQTARQALELARADPDYEDEEALGLLHLNMARSHQQLGNHSQARLEADFALNLLRDNYPQWVPVLHNVRGDLAIMSGDLPGALNAFNEGLSSFHPIRSPGILPRPHPDSLTSDQLVEATQLLGDRAALLASSNRPLEALADYELLFFLQDSRRENVSFTDSRTFLSLQLRPYFDRAIDLLTSYAAETDEEELLWDAFKLSERAKAYSLLKTLRDDRANRNQRETDLLIRIAELERLAVTDQQYAPALEAANLQLDRLLHVRQKSHYSEENEVSGREIIDLLRAKNKALLSFHIGAQAGHLFIVDPVTECISHRGIGRVDSLAGRANAWREAIKASAYQRKSLLSAAEQAVLDQEFVSRGHQLFVQLFGNEALPQGPLVVIPDGPLNVVPFACLLTAPVPGRVDYGSLPYLQNGRSITYSYSAEILRELDQRALPGYQLDLLAFAPTFSGGAGSGDPVQVQGGTRSLPGLSSLRFNEQEVKTIAGFFPDHKLYFGADANRENFLSEAGKARILHLSTHGLVDVTDPELSFVAFTQTGDSLELEEMLYFNDLTTLSLRAEMAVLSACETSLGKYLPGETTLSLASAFAAAGAKSTLTTLWQVDDEATMAVIEEFYAGLAEGLRRDEALAAAQQSQRMQRTFVHPHYWAGLTLYGEAGTLVPGKGQGGKWMGWVAGLLAGVLLIGIVWKLWPRKPAGSS